MYSPSPVPMAGLPATPPGWKAEWSAEYARYFYVDLSTGESVWTLDATTAPAAQHVVQRKPVAVSSGPSAQTQMDSRFGTCAAQQQPDLQGAMSGQYSVVQQQGQRGCIPAQSMQASQFSPPPTPGEMQCDIVAPQQQLQPHIHAQTPGHVPAQYASLPTPPVEQQRPNPTTPHGHTNSYAYFAPPPPAQYPVNTQAPQYTYPPPPQQQPYSPAPPPPQQQTRSWSLASTLSSHPSLTKWSSKLTQFQNKPSTPSAPRYAPQAQPQPKTGNPSGGSDWKKWTKRAAIGVAAVGALALGVDAIGDAGAAFGGDFGGGGDFSGGGGGDFTSGDVGGSEALDASMAQAAMEQQGQQNALMLLDPPGTTYTVVDGGSLI